MSFSKLWRKDCEVSFCRYITLTLWLELNTQLPGHCRDKGWEENALPFPNTMSLVGQAKTLHGGNVIAGAGVPIL